MNASLASLDDGRACIVVTGELDFSNAETVRTVLDGVLEGDPTEVIFDLEGLSFMDSSGIAVLVHAANQAKVELRKPTPIVLRVIQVTGLTNTFTIAQ